MSSTGSVEALRARVSQLAGVRGDSPSDVLRDLALGETGSESSWVPVELVDESLKGHSPRKEPGQLRPVIQAAYEAARESRDDWRSMPLPVLKNRLLALTNGDFHEWDYGWPNLRFLPRAYPDLLELDASTPHGAAAYVASPGAARVDQDESARPDAHVAATRGSGRRIREDLWKAVVDYRSGLKYVWDPSLARAVGVDGDDDDGRPTFPTIEANDVREWRSDCARKWVSLNGNTDRDSIDAWIDDPRVRVSNRFLEAWRADQRERVAARIADFFESVGLGTPADAFPSASAPTRPELTAREIVRLAAEVMSDSEIDSLQLSVSVVFRALQHGGHIR